MSAVPQLLETAIATSQSRVDLWSAFVDVARISRMAEVGVFRGQFAEAILQNCPSLETYYMVDPWRNMRDWNKPANVADDEFRRYMDEALSRTDFAGQKRVILRGTTKEVIDEVPDGSLDFAYIDADHTLRGITIDLLSVYPKVRPGGWIGGDDFSETIWQHDTEFEPTLVFPYAVYFAEAVDAPIWGLPYRQFLMQKDSGEAFHFEDLTGDYADLSLRDQLRPDKLPGQRDLGIIGRAKRKLRRLLR